MEKLNTIFDFFNLIKKSNTNNWEVKTRLHNKMEDDFFINLKGKLL